VLHGRNRAGLVLPWLSGLAASLLLACGAALPGSPLVLDRSGAWFFGNASGPPSRASILLSVAGLVGLGLAWLALLRALRSAPGTPPRRLAPLAASWLVPLLLAPPMLSHDVYLYAAQGRLFLAGGNPNLVPVGALPPDQYRRLVDPIWLSAPSLYGPLFSALEAGAVVVSRYHVLWTIVVLRMLAVLGFAALGAAVPRLARSSEVDPASAVALGLLNPLVLLYVVDPGRNDSLMLALIVVAVVLASDGHALAGIVVAAVGAAIKLPALGAVVFILGNWLAEPAAPPGRWRRSGRLLAGLGATAGVLEMAGVSTGLGWSWIGGLGASGRIWNFFTPDDALTSLLVAIGRVGGAELGRASLLGIVQVALAGLASVVCVWLLLSVRRIGLSPALGSAFLVVALAAPALHAWYLAWGTVLLAASLASERQGILIWIVLVTTLIFLPGPRTASADLAEAGAIVLVTVALRARAQRHRPGPAPAGEPG